ncbi:hypothetical protein KIW84_041614 [Lathyrus oleraceus]|uniref:Uncharacterized protein n=1 Tax=Pisum sativum TaxID=3888 RepID=A0A9D5API5_PEA|nr:hypothetical protein KIW84_041614 [Pisum sativum]
MDAGITDRGYHHGTTTRFSMQPQDVDLNSALQFGNTAFLLQKLLMSAPPNLQDIPKLDEWNKANHVLLLNVTNIVNLQTATADEAGGRANRLDRSSKGATSPDAKMKQDMKQRRCSMKL